MALVVLGAAGCASRQPATTELGQTAPPVRYESTVTTYFDLTTRTAPGQRKLEFGAPESTRCRILGNMGSNGGWVVPVIYEVTAPTGAQASPVAAAAPLAAATVAAPAADKPGAPVKPAAKGKAAKGKKGAVDKPAPATASAAPPTVVAAAVAQAVPSTPIDANTVALDNVSVTGKTRYFFWFDRETINAVTKRMDICP
jgi:hypothetical protein